MYLYIDALLMEPLPTKQWRVASVSSPPLRYSSWPSSPPRLTTRTTRSRPLGSPRGSFRTRCRASRSPRMASSWWSSGRRATSSSPTSSTTGRPSGVRSATASSPTFPGSRLRSPSSGFPSPLSWPAPPTAPSSFRWASSRSCVLRRCSRASLTAGSMPPLVACSHRRSCSRSRFRRCKCEILLSVRPFDELKQNMSLRNKLNHNVVYVTCICFWNYCSK
ncbi:unnamed protein product [Musa acuminata var. zebrina]